MKESERNIKVAEKEQEIRDLQSQLSCSSSDIGDWKIAKYMEYQLMQEKLPYDINELNQKRQGVRDKINAIQEEIKSLEAMEVEADNPEDAVE